MTYEERWDITIFVLVGALLCALVSLGHTMESHVEGVGTSTAPIVDDAGSDRPIVAGELPEDPRAEEADEPDDDEQ